MAYSTSSPPRLMVPAMNAQGPQVWAYSSADTDDTVNGASYFSNGVALGMNVGDLVIVYDTATPKVSMCYVASLSSTAATTAFCAVA